MTNFLDEDNNGEVDMQEFCKRITFLDFHKRSHQYIISEIQFLEQILNQWYNFRADELSRCMTMIHTFDMNADKMMSYEEFKKLFEKLEPSLAADKVLRLYQKCIVSDDNGEE